MSDFHEDDEPIEKIKAAFERAEKGLTGPPQGRTLYLAFSTDGGLERRPENGKAGLTATG